VSCSCCFVPGTLVLAGCRVIWADPGCDVARTRGRFEAGAMAVIVSRSTAHAAALVLGTRGRVGWILTTYGDEVSA